MHAGSAPDGQLAAGCVAMSGVTVQSLYSMSVPATLASRVCHAESAFIRRKDCTHKDRTPASGPRFMTAATAHLCRHGPDALLHEQTPCSSAGKHGIGPGIHTHNPACLPRKLAAVGRHH